MVPNVEQDYIFLLGYCILYMEHHLTGSNHQRRKSLRTSKKRHLAV